jgi:hypothetical protein
MRSPPRCTNAGSLSRWGYYVTETVGDAALALDDEAWRPALDANGEPRDGRAVSTERPHSTGVESNNTIESR